MSQRELDVSLQVLHNSGAPHILGSHNSSADDLDRAEAATMTASHLRVHLIDGASQGQIPVLAVHIVGTGARVVLDPDAVVLDDVTVLLGDLEWGSKNKRLGSSEMTQNFATKNERYIQRNPSNLKIKAGWWGLFACQISSDKLIDNLFYT